MLLTADHLIIRSATPVETLGELSERTGAPILADVEDVRGMASGFDVDAVRAQAGTGSSVVEVHLGAGGRREAWGRLPLDGGPQVHLDDAGPSGIRRIVLAGAAGAPFKLGDVEFAAAR